MKRRLVLGLLPLIFLPWLLFPLLGSAEESPFIWPIQGEVITPYKDGGAYESGSHRGIDIEAEPGSEVVAAASGTIHWIGKTPRGEPYVSVQHEGGLRTTYIPVEATVKRGQAVKRGEKLGTISSVGEYSSPLPHLHFGVKKEPYDSLGYLDPLSLLPPLILKSGGGEGAVPETPPVSEDSTVATDSPATISPAAGEILEPQPAREAPAVANPAEALDPAPSTPLAAGGLPEPSASPRPETSPQPVLEANPASPSETVPAVQAEASSPPALAETNPSASASPDDNALNSAVPEILQTADEIPLHTGESPRQAATQALPAPPIRETGAALPDATDKGASASAAVANTPQPDASQGTPENHPSLSPAIENGQNLWPIEIPPVSDRTGESENTFPSSKEGDNAASGRDFPWKGCLGIFFLGLAGVLIFSFRRQIFCFWIPQEEPQNANNL